MELPCTTYLLCGVLLYMAYTVSGQGGGVAIGFGGGDLMVDSPFGGEMPSPFLTMVAQDMASNGVQTTITPPMFTAKPRAGTLQTTASTPTMGDGLNPTDALAMLGGPGPGVSVNSANANNDYLVQTQSQTGDNSGQTATSVAQIDPVTGNGFTLQNEAYTPMGSTGNLVMIPIDGNKNKDALGKTGETLTNANQAFANVVVQPVTNSIDNTQLTSNSIADNISGTNSFNPGSGNVDEIKALQSASALLNSPVDMSNFLPPPYIPDNVQTSQGNQQPSNPTSINKAADSSVSPDFSSHSNQGVSMNVPVNTNSNIVNDPANTNLNLNVNTGFAVNVPYVENTNPAIDVNAQFPPPPYSPDGNQISQGNQQPNGPTNINIIPSDFSSNSNQGFSMNVPVDTNSNIIIDPPAITDLNTNVNTEFAVNVPYVENTNPATDVNTQFPPPPYSPGGNQISQGNQQPNDPTNINIIPSDFSSNSNQGFSMNVPVDPNSNIVNDPTNTNLNTNVNTEFAVNVPYVENTNPATDVNAQFPPPPFSPDGNRISQGNQQPNDPTNINMIPSDFSSNSNKGFSMNVPVDPNSNIVNDPANTNLNSNVNTGFAVNVPYVENTNPATDVNPQFLPPPYSPNGNQISQGNQQPNDRTNVNIIPSDFSSNSNQGFSMNVPVDTNSNILNDPANTNLNTNVNTEFAANVPNVQNTNPDVNAQFLPPPYNPAGNQISQGNQQVNDPSNVNTIPSEFSGNSQPGVSLNVPVNQNIDMNSNILYDPAVTNLSTDMNTGVADNLPNVQDMKANQPISSGFGVTSNRNMPVDVPAIPDINSNIHESAVVNNNPASPSSNAFVNTQPHDGTLNEQVPRKSLRDMFSSPNAPIDNSVGGIATVIEPNTAPINQLDTPHLQDLTAEGIYPFEGSFMARNELVTESSNIIQDMNTAITSHNSTTETLHLENPVGGINDVPPLTGTNGGPITNLVGVNPSEFTGSNQGSPLTNPIDAQIQAVDNTQFSNQFSGFTIGAGMPNAQLIQTGLGPDTVSSNINTGGGLSLTGASPDMSGFSLPYPDTAQNAQFGNEAINDMSAQFTSGSNMGPQSNFADNTHLASMTLSQAIPGQEPTQQGINTAEIQISKTASPSIQQGIETSNMATLALPDFTSLANPVVQTASLNQNGGNVNNMVDMSFAINSDTQRLPFSNEQLASLNMQQATAALNNQAVDPNKLMNVADTNANINTQTSFGGLSDLQTPTAFQSQTGSVSNQQIVNVRPGWMSNVFGSIGQGQSIQLNTDQPVMSVKVPDASTAVDPMVAARDSPINPSEPFPMQTFINPMSERSGAFPQQLPTADQFSSFIDNTMPISNPDMTIVPLTSGPVTPDNSKKVFTLGDHRVIDSVLASQQQQRSVNLADYLTQNVIGASDTKPLVTDRNMQVAGQGTAQNQIENQLKQLMMSQQAQVASSTPQRQSPDSSSVLTSFEAPGMSFGQSVAVSDNVGISITPESNVPVTGGMSSFVQQPVIGGFNDGGLNDISGTKRSSNQLSFQFGPSESRPNAPTNQQNSLWNTEPVVRQTGINNIATGGQAIPVQIGTGTQVITPGQQDSNMNTLNTFANGLRLGQPVGSIDVQPTGLMLPLGPNSGAAKFSTGGRAAIFGANAGTATRTFENSVSGNNGVYVAPNVQQFTGCFYEADPTSQYHFIMRRRGGVIHTFRCALGTAYDPASCECSRRVTARADCLEVHMDFNNGVVEDSSYNKLPIGNQNVEVTNKSTPLSGIALFNSTGKLTIWRYQNYDFRDNVMLKVQFRPGQIGDRFQPLISNCDGGMEGPSIGIIYDNQLKEVLLVLKAVNETKKELSFPINAQEWNDVTYIYDGQEFIGIVNGVRRYVSRQDPHLIGIIGGDIKSMPARGLIEIRDAGIIMGHCPRYGYYNGAMVDIQIYTCIPKAFRLE